MTTADLVLEGGGAKLPGLVGAVDGLVAAGYDFHRIAGTSAGAIVGSLLAAGLGPDRLVELVMQTDFAGFEDVAPGFRLWPDLGKVGGLLSNFPVDVFDRKDHGDARWPTLGDAAKRELMDSGRDAAARFLETWDWDEWRAKYGPA